MIDEEGTNVSAAQRQLITIARAFLTEPALLILLMMENGRIVETGTHESLLAPAGPYFAAYAA